MMEMPDKAGLSAIVERYARLLSVVAAEVGERPAVLPTAEFFPDPFTGDAASASALVVRMLEHAGLTDVPLTTRVVDEDGPEAPHSGCSSGCAVPGAVEGTVPRLVDADDHWTLHVPAYELSHPVVLTTMIARALGHVFLAEALPRGMAPEAPADLTADYAAVALGFGPLLLEGAYIYSKGCGGPQVAQVTRAGLSELAVLTALFVEMGRHSGRRVLREVGTTQASVLDHALEWAKSNPALVEALRDEPVRVAMGHYTLAESRPWLLRLFGKKRASVDALGAAEPRVRAGVARPPTAPDPEHDELRALVDEALDAARADAE